MKLLIVSSTFPEFKAGGVPRYVEGRRQYLSRRISVRIAARGPTLDLPGRASLGERRGLAGLLLAWAHLVWLVVRWRPDVVEVHNIPVGLPLLLTCPLRYVFHGPAGLEARAQGRSAWRVAFATALEWICLQRASSLHCVSPHFMALLKTTVLSKPTSRHARRVIAPRIEHAWPLPAISAGGSLLLVCRRLVPRTGIDIAINAFSLVARELDSQLCLRIIGEGPEGPALERLAASLPMGRSTVEFTGAVSDEMRDTSYQEASFQLVPTRYFEGFGLVVAEAALFGCPSIVTDVDALPWVIGELDHIGDVVKADPAAVAEAIRVRLLEPWTQDQRRQLQACAMRRFGVRCSEGRESTPRS